MNIGGPAIHVLLLTKYLNKEQFTSLLVYGGLENGEAQISGYEDKGQGSYFVPELSRQISVIRDIFALLKIIRIVFKERPDIIHTHTAKAGTLGRLAGVIYNCARFYRKPALMVHTFHGHVFNGYFSNFVTKVFVQIEKILASVSDKIITLSPSLKAELLELGIGNRSKIEIIPLGFELDRFLDIQAKEAGVSPRIGIIGRLVPIKNHPLFLNAAAVLLKSNDKLRFKIVGDGQSKEQLLRLAEQLDISRFVDFLGWQEDLSIIYKELDLVVLTSINEGTPVSLIEAMASGRAVIATDVGGVGDLLGGPLSGQASLSCNGFRVMERGLLIRPESSPEVLASAIEFILRQDNLRQIIIASARKYVFERFNKERLLGDVETLYLRILGLKS